MGMKTYSIEEALELIDADHRDRSKKQKVRDWLTHRAAPLPGRAWRHAAGSLQRSRRGWSDDDVWGLRWHLCESLGTALLHLASNGVSYPGRGEYNDPEAWRRDLRAHGTALRSHAGSGNDPAEEDVEARLAAAQEALHWVADNLGDLYD